VIASSRPARCFFAAFRAFVILDFGEPADPAMTIPSEGHRVNDLEAAAEKAELTGQIRSFMTWLGEGRKLTQTGRIGLADARDLVVALGTGDKIDPEIGGRVFKRSRSAICSTGSASSRWKRCAGRSTWT
jgi:hypothetical protein